MVRIGRNQECPCESGLKFKKCCKGKVDWESIPFTGDTYIRHLSLRGKNLLFLADAFEALQFDRLDRDRGWAAIKKACSADVVRRIHEAVVRIWPGQEDLRRVLWEERGKASALYVGTYEPATVMRGITRHSLYTDRILLIDPFQYAPRVRPEYNPLENPEMHRIDTVRSIRLWIALSPWIEAGLVNFIRSPGDYDYSLWRTCIEREETKYEQHPELRESMENQVRDFVDSGFDDYEQFMMLSMPDDYLVRRYLEEHPEADEFATQRFMRWIQARREDHPYYIPAPDGGGRPLNHQLLHWSSGANYELAKVTAQLTGAHLVTDLQARWKEVALDKNAAKLGEDPWQPFARAFSDVELKFLDQVPLPAALTLRREGRLEKMRSFLRRVWHATALEDPYDESGVRMLKDELTDHIDRANEEWRKINVELSKWFGAETGASIATLPQFVSSGTVEWLAAGILTATVANVGAAWYKRRMLVDRTPAAFLLRLKKTQEGSDE